MSNSNSNRGKKVMLGCVGVGVSVIIIGGFLLYWGYCWGWWGRGNLLLQSWFQCNCPAASEEVRYRPFKVVVSACNLSYLYGMSPSGRYLLLGEARPRSRFFRLDLETQQILELAPLGQSFFLSDTTILMISSKEVFVLDLNDGSRVTIRRSALGFNQTLDSTTLEIIRNAEQVILVEASVLALAHDYKQSLAQNVFIEFGDPDKRAKLLTNEKITYSQMPVPYTRGKKEGALYSRNGQLWADYAGIYLAQTQQQVVATNEQAPSDFPFDGYAPSGWVKNDQAVVYSRGGVRYIIQGGFIWGAAFPVPQPVLLLEVPQQYKATPAP